MSGNKSREIWFKRKQFGWGWTPCTWQGWVAVALFVFADVLIVLHVPLDASVRDIFIQMLLPLALLTLAFIRFCYAYGEKPRWQWGKDVGDAK